MKSKGDTVPDISNCERNILYNIPSNTEHRIRSHNNWDVLFKSNPSKVLRIYLINEDSFSKYGTCKILKEQIFIKRYDLTYLDLKNANWRIIFDGR
jgi:hypothetical protein